MGLKISQMVVAGALDGTEPVEVAQLSPSVTITATTISAAAADNSYNDSGSGFVAAGFAVLDQVKVIGFTGNVANNIYTGQITALTTAKMTIGGTDGDVIVDDAAGESVTITKWLTRRTTAAQIAALGMGTSFGWFNVVDYGATGDGSTDDTSSIQDAIDAAEAAGGGVVYFPAGVYVVNGALQDTGRSNAQLMLPRRDYVDTEQITIEFQGAFAPPNIASVVGATTIPDNHSVIKGTLNAGAGGALLGAQGPVGTLELFTNVYFVCRNLTFRMPSNPVLTGLNLLKVAAVDLDNVIVDTGSYDVAGLSAETTSTSYGIKLPDINNGACTKLGTVNVIGFYNGMLINEHIVGQNVNIWGCLRAVESAASNHASIFQRLGIYHCVRGIIGIGGESWLNVDQLNLEHAASGTWAPVYDIDDASHYLKGRISSWHTVLAGTGADTTLLVNGANIFRRRKINADRVHLLTDAANIATNCNLANNFRVTLGGNRTLDNPTALQEGEVYNWRIHQDGTGSRTLAYGSKFKFPGGAPTLSTAASAKDFISCQYDVTDDTLYCAIIKAMA